MNLILGVTTLKKNGLNNHKEASDLTEAVKQTLTMITFKLIMKVINSG
jgi:hypothetical protein